MCLLVNHEYKYWPIHNHEDKRIQGEVEPNRGQFIHYINSGHFV